MDNCEPHETDIVDSRRRVTIMKLPPDCTALPQPMDLGFISAWKIKYRIRLLYDIFATIETTQKHRESSRASIARIRVMEEVFDPQLLDVSIIVKKAWETYHRQLWLVFG